MSKELIKIEERNGMKAVNARELHKVLKSKQEFSNWIKNRIDKYGFVENQDFVLFDKIIKREIGASVRKEYALSIDMAKELAMVENNEPGRAVRRYFIECEKKLKELSAPSYLIEDSIERAKAWIKEEEERRRLALENQEQQKLIEAQKQELKDNEPDVAFSQAVIRSSDCILVGHLAKMIAQNGVDIGQNRLFKWLRDNGYLCNSGRNKNLPYQEYIEQGLFFIEESTVETSCDVRIVRTTLVTGKGQKYFINKFLQK